MARRISKPVGVTIGTILTFVFWGVVPILAILFAIRSTENQIPTTYVFVTLFLAGFTAASSVWAFIGDNEGRIALLSFLSLSFFWVIFLNITGIAASEK